MHAAVAAAALLALLAGCAVPKHQPEPQAVALPEKPRAKPVSPERRAVQPITGAALVVRLLPAHVAEREGWAADIHEVLASLDLRSDRDNACAVIAIVEQESGFRTDPPVPGLAQIAAREIDRRREAAGVPLLLVQAALALPSSDGRSYRARLESARTEKQLSDIYEDFARRLPLGRKFFADENPVRTGGPMQVSIRFAEVYAAARPFPSGDAIRESVFTRRGGLYFGIAHLLDYPAPYDDPIYRFADYNAGRFASRNAAFQAALARISGIELEPDGRLGEKTAQAALRIASPEEVRRDLALAEDARFERSPLYRRVFGLAGPQAPRALVPAIEARSPKTSRPLTAEGFAKRTAERHAECLMRASRWMGRLPHA